MSRYSFTEHDELYMNAALEQARASTLAVVASSITNMNYELILTQIMRV